MEPIVNTDAAAPGVAEVADEHEGLYHRVGSMFCLFFSEQPVSDLDSAMAVDKPAFGKFFHACLERGVYFAPSPYETGFLCLAHAADDIERTVEVVGEALAAV